jgi:hypothetical protein
MSIKALPVVALSLSILGNANVAWTQEVQKLFIEGDIVRGLTPNGATGPVCVLASQRFRYAKERQS